MKALIRRCVFWPNMEKEIEGKVKFCRGCAIAAKASPVKFTPWPKTDRPWLRLDIDFAGPIKGHNYLIVVDSFSKWPEMMKRKISTYSGTNRFLHELFSRFGIPDNIVSDNGTQFTAKISKILDCLFVCFLCLMAYQPL